MRHPSRLFALVPVFVLAAGTSLATDPPDSQLNPGSGNIESVDSVWSGSGWTVRHVVDRGQGAPPLATLLSDSPLDDLGPRIAIGPAGETAVVWWTDGPVAEVLVRFRASADGSWSAVRRVSEEGESSRGPEIVSDGSRFRVAFEIALPGGETGIAVTSIIDDQEPFPTRTVLATTTTDLDVDVVVHFESGKLWVTWVDGAQDVGWCEHDGSTGTWSAPAFEPYAEDGASAARERIRNLVLGG